MNENNSGPRRVNSGASKTTITPCMSQPVRPPEMPDATQRTRTEIVTFLRPFILTGLDGIQPAGRYTVETDEELLPTMSSTAYRRLVTWFRLPAIQPDGCAAPGRIQAAPVDPTELEAALDRDAMLGSELLRDLTNESTEI